MARFENQAKRCLYTYVELNRHEPPDDATASLEHIVPYALGGSDAFAIPYCSKKANNDFGASIDAPFLSLPIVGLKRHEFGLKSYSGKIPDFRFRGDCVELSCPCDVVFPYGDPPYADLGVQVTGGLSEGNRMSFSGSRDRLSQAVGGAMQKARKKGLALLDSNQELIGTVDDAFDLATIKTGETLHFRIGYGREVFFVPWSRGILKIALGLGAFALGPTWAFSPEADMIRSALLLDDASFPGSTLRGSTTMRFPEEIARLLQPKSGEHVLAVLPDPDGGMTAWISLFGGELLDAMVHLGDGPADVRRVNDCLPTDWKCVFKIDPTSRAFASFTLAEVNARLA